MSEISIFATFYILAQIIERVLEPISELPALCKKPEPQDIALCKALNRMICPISDLFRFLLGDKTKISMNERKIKDYQKKIDEMVKKEGASTDEIDKIEGKIDALVSEIRMDKAKRTFGLWFAASILGWVLCWKLQIGLISAVVALVKSGVPAVNETITATAKVIIPQPTIPPRLDFFLTGMLVGSGTKPLHDLIARIEETAKK
ncbi:MAG: hypothetical protein IB616_01720 [Methanosarcinales archaeon]|nr:MAG: hypothetical protein IB616_01720 [Methanosarcinales archaeon]